MDFSFTLYINVYILTHCLTQTLFLVQMWELEFFVYYCSLMIYSFVWNIHNFEWEICNRVMFYIQYYRCV